MITKNNVLNAWKKYNVEFDREKIVKESNIIGNAFNEFESEMLYSFIRLIKPKFIIEMSPDKGFTTSIIIEACNKNRNKSEIYSFDLHDGSRQLDIKNGKVIRKLITANAVETITDFYIKQCDFMFIDSEHTYSFGEWYSMNLLPKLKENTPIWIHDWPMYKSNGAPCNFTPEDYEEAPAKQGEPRAVKEHFINKGMGKPILNCTDVLKEQGKEYKDDISGMSPSQLLIRTENESNSDSV